MPAKSAISPFLNPGSIAIVGAGERPTSSGGAVLRNLRVSGYAGRIVPVNPKGGEIDGLEVAVSLRQMKSPVDLVAVLVRPDSILDVVAEAARLGHQPERRAVEADARIRDAGHQIAEHLQRRVVARRQDRDRRIAAGCDQGLGVRAAGHIECVPGHVGRDKFGITFVAGVVRRGFEHQVQGGRNRRGLQAAVWRSQHPGFRFRCQRFDLFGTACRPGADREHDGAGHMPVSYTHLTLPTIYSV